MTDPIVFNEAQCVRLRGIQKRRLTLIVKSVDKYLSDPESHSINLIKECERDLQEARDEYNKVQEFIEINAEDPDKHFDDREEFIEKCRTIAVKMSDILEVYYSAPERRIPSPVPSLHSNNSFRVASNENLVTLPPIELKKFNGDLKSFVEFRETFEALVIKNSNLNNVQKMYYLKHSLSGEPLNLVQNLPISEQSFQIAWDLIYKRYNNSKILLSYHLKNLLNLPEVKVGKSEEYRALINQLLTGERSVKSLLNDGVLFHEALLVELVLTKLRKADRQAWDQAHSETNVSLKTLVEYLENRAQCLELSDYRNSSDNVSSDKPRIKPSAKAFVVNEVQCLFCERSGHAMQDCRKFISLSMSERKKACLAKSICCRCLKSGKQRRHEFKSCPAVCSKCKLSHHVLLHVDRSPNESVNLSHSSVGLKTTQISQVNTLLPTCTVQVVDKNNKIIPARAILDSGATSSFISSDLVRKLNIPTRQTKFSVTGLNEATTATIMKLCDIKLKCQDDQSIIKVQCAVLDIVTSPLPLNKINISTWKLPADVRLSDPRFHEPGPVQLLLGADIFFQVIKGNPRMRTGFPTILGTKFGHVLSGVLPTSNTSRSNRAQCHFSRVDILETQLRQFWELEQFDTIPKTKEQKYCEQHFVDNFSRDENGQFVVRLPIRLEVSIGNTRDQAIKRMSLLERKFVHNKPLHKAYSDFMQEYLNLGHMEVISNAPEENEFVLPHHAVYKLNSTSTKLRVVFDSSAISTNHYSLNDLTCVGPSIQDTLYSIVLRFRRYPVALTADISKMYRCVLVAPADRKLQKIVWRCNPTDALQTYQLTTVTYGVSCASFLATRCLFQLAVENESNYPIAAEAIKNQFYMDDLLYSCFSVSEANELYSQLTHVLDSAHFPLRKWSSNSDEALDIVPISHRENLSSESFKSIGEQMIQALGIYWSPPKDSFHFLSSIKEISRLTKRTLLSAISSIFDPLGLISPVSIKCKILIQKLWQLKLSWDVPLPPQVEEEWKEIHSQLPSLSKLSIDRKLILSSDITRVELHGFCDASTQAYGACLYLKTVYSTGLIHSVLITSKSRVAPLKQVTLPRLELCGCVLLARLVTQVISSLQLKQLDQVFLWCDSTIALSWLHSDVSKLKTFVANRVSEIQEITNIECWNHISTLENPADLVTRGLLPNQLLHNELWWSGPHFLKQSIVVEKFKPEFTNTSEFKPVSLLCQSVETNDLLKELILKFSSLKKLERVVAYVRRFLHNVRFPSNKYTGCLSTAEVDEASLILIKHEQSAFFSDEIRQLKGAQEISKSSHLKTLAPFVDNEGTLRVGGRLNNADVAYDTKHQIIMHHKSPLSELIIRETHLKLLHSGFQSVLADIRLKFWMPSCRNVIKRILRSCVTCFKLNASQSTQLMGQLPPQRVQPSFPFQHTGVDYCGPFNMKCGNVRSKTLSKMYVAVFVCFATRAVHFEPVTDLTTLAFLAALKRFIARRGMPSCIQSDNGTNFVGAAKQLKDFLKDPKVKTSIEEFCLDHKFTWSFNPSRASHFGGKWESEIKVLKTHMKKTIGSTILTFEEYLTLLLQIEQVMNSRPITAASDDPNSELILTPGHFLIGRPTCSLPESPLLGIPVSRLNRWKHLQFMLQSFWRTWSATYLTSLQQRNKWFKESPNVKVGQVVLVKEDNVPPLCWRTGIVTDVFPGEDKKVRVINVRVGTKTYRRPLTKVSPLPIE